MEFLSNPFSLAAFSAVIISVFAVQIMTKKVIRNKVEKKYPPVGGTVFHHFFNFNRLHHFMTDLARKHKTYRILGLFRHEIYTSDPANVEYILKTNFDNYGKVFIPFSFDGSEVKW